MHNDDWCTKLFFFWSIFAGYKQIIKFWRRKKKMPKRQCRSIKCVHFFQPCFRRKNVWAQLFQLFSYQRLDSCFNYRSVIILNLNFGQNSKMQPVSAGFWYVIDGWDWICSRVRFVFWREYSHRLCSVCSNTSLAHQTDFWASDWWS